jgi:hypothetical protein
LKTLKLYYSSTSAQFKKRRSAHCRQGRRRALLGPASSGNSRKQGKNCNEIPDKTKVAEPHTAQFYEVFCYPRHYSRDLCTLHTNFTGRGSGGTIPESSNNISADWLTEGSCYLIARVILDPPWFTATFSKENLRP